MSTENITRREQFKLSLNQEQYLYSVNRNTFAKDLSSSIYKRQYEDKLIKDKNFYIILGTDSGLLIKHIIQQKSPSDTRYIFIELPHLIDVIKEKTHFSEWPDNVRITSPEEWQDTAIEFGIELYIYKNSVSYIKSLAAIYTYLPAYSDANLTFEKDYQAFYFFTRATLAVSPFMKTQLENICENKYPATKLVNAFIDKTAVILAGGPSLDENIAWVKSNKQNMVIIAVSRIAKKLIQEELIPHIVVSVDPFDISFDVSKELLKFPPEVLFIHSNNVTSLLLSQWQGKSAYMGKRFSWEEESDKGHVSIGGPTVTNTALKMAISMGFANILLSGVDLCFSEKGVTHASGSNEAKIGPTLGQLGAWVETYAGNKVETLIVFENAADSLSGQAKAALEQDTVIYNLSKNAAKVEYIEHIPPEAISFENENNNFFAEISALLPENSLESIRQDYKFVLMQVSNKLSVVKKIYLLVKEALECNKKLFQTKGKEEENYRYKLKMDKIEHKIDSRYKNTVRFIKNFGIDKFIFSAQTDTSEEWSDRKLEETGRLYYQAYIDSCKSLITHLTNTKERISNRIEEEKSAPNFQYLLNQWGKDRSYGRASVWLNSNLHKAIKLPKNVQNEFIGYQKKFDEVIANENTRHLSRTKKEASLKGVRRKIITLFHQGNTDGLKVLSQSLAIHPLKATEALPLHQLSQAYYYYATENYPQALSSFEALPVELIQEDELQRINAIAFKLADYSLASACLEKLTLISDSYQPQYAKLRHLLGDNESAITLYTDYLTANPNEIPVWLSLGKLYLSLEVFEAAQMAFKEVLTREPENISALDYLDKISK